MQRFGSAIGIHPEKVCGVHATAYGGLTRGVGDDRELQYPQLFNLPA